MTIYTVPDYQHQMNIKERDRLTLLGYRFKVNGDGYQVWYNDEYLGGAGVQLPRRSNTRRSMIHIQADMRNYLDAAISLADKHLKKSIKEELPTSIELIASGYEWVCPNCDAFNKTIEVVETVTCYDCGHTFGVSDHHYALP